MAQFFGLIPLNAANFESGAAGDGQVLTADGSGGAAWEDVPAGPGGASFAFDGATFTPGEFVAGSQVRSIEVELTLSGSSIATGGAWVIWGLMSNNTATPPTLSGNTDLTDTDYSTAPSLISWGGIVNNIAHTIWMVSASGGSIKFTAGTYNAAEAAEDIYLFVLLPSGGFVFSSAISIPGSVA